MLTLQPLQPQTNPYHNILMMKSNYKTHGRVEPHLWAKFKEIYKNFDCWMMDDKDGVNDNNGRLIQHSCPSVLVIQSLVICGASSLIEGST